MLRNAHEAQKSLGGRRGGVSQDFGGGSIVEDPREEVTPNQGFE